MLYSLEDLSPKVHETAFVAPSAQIIGDVEILEGASVWFNCVLRGDAGKIIIGKGTNIQDGTVIHEETTIGENCVVAHQCLVHRCTVGNNVIIGNGALVFGPAEIGENCVIGAGSVVIPGSKIPKNSLVLGIPGKVAREPSQENLEMTARTAANYQRNRDRYLKNLKEVK
tara:strand:+ start:4579 stop:5088 length:510 start_codon:yes stop_codon:yes gene_type:complete